MPKFHDEFFKKGTPRHDGLVIKTKESIKEIVDQLNKKLVFIPHYLKNDNKKISLYICESGNSFCSLANSRTAFNTSKDSCYGCKYWTEERINNLAPKNEKAIIKECDVEYNPQPIEILNIEIEKICKKERFIVGYIDILVNLSYNIKGSIKIYDGWAWDNYRNTDVKILLVIDAKPDLDSWGGPLRQIKTYMDNEGEINKSRVYGVFTTYSKISDETKKTLESENVFVIEFDENIPQPKTKLEDYGG